MKRSTDAFPLTYAFFPPNIYGLMQSVLKWEGKVVAVAADAGAVEMNWNIKSPQTGVT